MDPIPLHYAPQGHQRPWIVRTWRIWAAVGVILGLGYVFVVTCSGWANHSDACSECGASRRVSSLYLFGANIDYSIQVDKGVVCESLEKHEATNCLHTWLFASGSSPCARAQGAGLRVSATSRAFRYPRMGDVLDAHLRNDPTFSAKLRQLIRDGAEWDTPLIQSLWAEAEALEKAGAAVVP